MSKPHAAPPAPRVRRERRPAWALRRSLCLLGLCLAAGRTAAADAQPPAGAVTVQEVDGAIALANDEVALRFDREKGTLTSLTRHGQELLAPGGGYVQIAFTSRRDDPRTHWEYRLVRRTAELVEIAFVDTSPECPFDFSAHYVLRAGEPGFHNYLTWGHDAQRTPGVIRLAQYDFALRIDPRLFTTAAVDDRRIARLPASTLLTPERAVMDSTYLLPDGGYYSKYFFSAERDERHPVHGAMGDGLGIWMIMPSQEHLNGGPEHQELTVHQAGASQVLLAHAQGAHYGAGILTSDARDGSWRKASAPWFVYVNSASSQAALWEDAKRRAAAAVAAWPYRWLDDATFQLERATVSGRSLDASGAPIAGARVILADHEESSGPLLWQQQWRGYRFSGWTDQDGRYAIGAVRAGTYDLFIWQPGEFGHFILRGIEIGGGGRIDLGALPWLRQTGRQTLWQIGIPDHSAQEFGFAEDFRQWGLWRRIADARPDGVDFVVGASTARDWPFEMAVVQGADRTWRAPTWRIRFDGPAQRPRRALLTLGIAGYEGRQKPQLVLALNGEEIATIGDLEVSGAAHRSGVHAGYQERQVIVPGERLKSGANVLTIGMPAAGRAENRAIATPEGALLWDAIRLEALP